MQERNNHDTVKKIGNTTIRFSDLYLVRNPEDVAAILERIKRKIQFALSSEDNNRQHQK